MVLTEHQDLREQIGKDREDVRPRLLDHYQQILICHKGLIIPLICRYHEQLVEAIKGGLLHPFHKPTSLLLSYTTQNKNVSNKSAIEGNQMKL